MMITIDHIGIALDEFGDTANILKIIGLESHHPEEVPNQKVNTWSFQAGESELELLAPTSEESPIAKYIDKKGQGIHHLALRVENVKAEIEKLSSAGVKMIDHEPRLGAGNKLIAFIHPKSTGGILIELTQPL
ncbi:MAG: methylmalonyl-CoA epimerase [FCB group bacterium]|nr:methylmalonyl-CoA epimerase [FCB group bacterium]